MSQFAILDSPSALIAKTARRALSNIQSKQGTNIVARYRKSTIHADLPSFSHVKRCAMTITALQGYTVGFNRRAKPPLISRCRNGSISVSRKPSLVTLAAASPTTSILPRYAETCPRASANRAPRARLAPASHIDRTGTGAPKPLAACSSYDTVRTGTAAAYRRHAPSHTDT